MTAKLGIKQLCFDLPENIVTSYCQVMQASTEKVRQLARNSGTGSNKFKLAFQRFLDGARQRKDLDQLLKDSIDLRVLAIALKSSDAPRIQLSEKLLHKVDYIRPRPSSLLLESIYSYYLNHYDKLDDLKSVEAWLRKSKDARGGLDQNTANILGGDGPKWLAETCHKQQVDFNTCIDLVGLAQYASGRFLENAKNIYYLESIRNLEADEQNEILLEIQRKEVYESRYSENALLGHEILKILIAKAEPRQISDHWMNVIMAVAGDPRTSTRNERYIRWWSQIPKQLVAKVHGWLSKLDLRLFLEALEDFSNQPGNSELKRMYPSRKQFLEGLLKQELVTGTRLFLTYDAERFIKKSYKVEHLPTYSIVEGSTSKSLVYISLSGTHVVEGTHSCKFWVYRWLPDSAEVLNYNRRRFTYSELTAGMETKLLREHGVHRHASITHSGQWQVKAAIALKEAGVNIDTSILLTKAEYQRYKFEGHL